MEDTYNNLSGNKTRLLGGNRSQANRKHTFVDHSDGDSDGEREEKNQDMRDEDELSDGVEELGHIVGKLKEAAIGMGDGIGAQIQTVDRINQKVSSLTANLENLVSFTNIRSQTERVDDHVSHPWHGKPFSPFESFDTCTKALWMLNQPLPSSPFYHGIVLTSC